MVLFDPLLSFHLLEVVLQMLLLSFLLLGVVLLVLLQSLFYQSFFLSVLPCFDCRWSCNSFHSTRSWYSCRDSFARRLCLCLCIGPSVGSGLITEFSSIECGPVGGFLEDGRCLCPCSFPSTEDGQIHAVAAMCFTEVGLDEFEWRWSTWY